MVIALEKVVVDIMVDVCGGVANFWSCHFICIFNGRRHVMNTHEAYTKECRSVYYF